MSRICKQRRKRYSVEYPEHERWGGGCIKDRAGRDMMEKSVCTKPEQGDKIQQFSNVVWHIEKLALVKTEERVMWK